MCNDEGVTDKALLTSVCFFISFDLVSNPGSTFFFLVLTLILAEKLRLTLQTNRALH